MITKLNLIFWPLLAFEKIRGDSNGRIKVHRRQHTKKRARVCKSIVNIQQRKLRISGQNGWNKNSDINGCHKWHSLCSRVLKNRMMWKTKHLNTFSLENLLMQFCVTNCGFGVSGNPDLISITHTYTIPVPGKVLLTTGSGTKENIQAYICADNQACW